MHLPPAAVDRLRWAALLHDIGKLRVPAATLNKPAKLSSSEWDVIREHPLAGAELASALLPWLGEWGRAIAEHHERFDGSGYPLGISGRDISVAGRIVAVADSFEVMTAARAYKKALTRTTALEEVVRCSGKQFDPDVVRALLAVSAPRLRWAMGPTSWLVGTPVLGSVPSLTAAGVGVQAAVGVTAVAVAGATGLTAQAATAAGSGPSATPHAISAGRAQPVPTPTPSSNRSTHPTHDALRKAAKPASHAAGSATSVPAPHVAMKATRSDKAPPTQPPGQAKKSTAAATTTTPTPAPQPAVIVTPSVLPGPTTSATPTGSSKGGGRSGSAGGSSNGNGNGSSSSSKPGVVPTLVAIIHKLLG
jgi:putative nucleotidyltransferase with HDIG domain